MTEHSKDSLHDVTLMLVLICAAVTFPVWVWLLALVLRLF